MRCDRCALQAEHSPAGACFSDDRASRYLLWRAWDFSKPVLAFIGLNPSIANEQDLDPTLRRVFGFARDWGYGGMRVVNAFARVSTDPKGLKGIELADPVNDQHIQWTADFADLVMLGWGSNMTQAHLVHRRNELRELLRHVRTPIKAWKVTASGDPQHPLYLRADTKPREISIA